MTVVLIVEDHSLMSESVSIALDAEGFSSVVSTAKTRDELLARAKALKPDIVLLDLDLGPGLGNGLDLIAKLRRARVVIVSGTRSRLDLAVALESGAYGYFEKRRPMAELIEAVKTVADGRLIVSAGERQALLAELYASRLARQRELEPFNQLTPREQQVLRGILAGARVRDLARDSSLSPLTMRTHVRGVLTKLGVTSQVEAIALARRAGWPPVR